MPPKRKREDDNFDNGRVQELADLLKSAESDITPLASFLDRNLWTQVIQAWSYYSQTSNHARLSTTSSKIAWLLATCDKNASLTQYGTSIIREIIENQMKVLYRSLHVSRPSVTNAALHILLEITKFHDGVLAVELFEKFDSSQKIYTKLLSIKEIRPEFLKFYQSFIENTPSAVRKDLLSQRKIISGWFKHINDDEEELVSKTLDMLKDKVLLEKVFTKSTKISFFNDWMIGSLVKLFQRSDDVPVKLEGVLEILCTDSQYGVKFFDKGWYSETINNKLLLSLLKTLKPWEDTLQQNLAVKILETTPELVAPYTKQAAESVSFDPKLSSFWVSYSNFCTRLIRLPLPVLTSQPIDSIVVENVLPSMLSKSSLTKGLQSTVSLIRYFTVQLLFHSLKKLDMLQKLYAENKWDLSAVLQEISLRLPDIQTFTTCLGTLGESSTLLKTLALSVIAKYSIVYPELLLTSKFSLPGQYFLELQSADKLEGLKLLQAKSTLTVQARTNKIGKWYNKTGSYSMFTSLLRLGVFKTSLTEQVCDILRDLTSPTLLLQNETTVHPVHALIYSLQQVVDENEDQIEKIWSLIDEAVARCMRSPYKYIDMLAQKQDRPEQTLSPLLITLAEQFGFVKEPRDIVDKWICLYFRYSCIFGESFAVARKLVEGLSCKDHVEESHREAFDENDLFKFIVNAPSEAIRDYPYWSMSKIFNLEFAAIRYRLLREPQLSPWLIGDNLLSVASLPLSLITSVAFFKDIASLTPATVKQYFDILMKLQLKLPHSLLSAIQMARDDVKCYAAYFLDGEEISALTTSTNARVFSQMVRLKSLRYQVISTEDIQRFINLSTEHKDDIEMSYDALDENLLKYGQQLSMAETEKLVELLIANDYTRLVTSVVKARKFFPGDLASRVKDITCMSAIATYTDINDPEIYLPFARDILSDPAFNTDQLAILARSVIALAQSDLAKIKSFMDNADGAITVSLEMMHLAAALYEKDESMISVWARKVILWLTKCLNEPDRFTSVTVETIKNLGGLLAGEQTTVNLWKLVPAESVNALLTSAAEKLNKLVSDTEYQTGLVEMLLAISFSDAKSKLEYTRLFQILLNHEQLPREHPVALLLWNLYYRDSRAHSTQVIQDGLLKLYRGTASMRDRLLLDMIRSIEAHTNTSWVNRVSQWTFIASDVDREYALDNYADLAGSRVGLVRESKEGFEVFIDTVMVKNTIDAFSPFAVPFPVVRGASLRDCQAQINIYNKCIPGGSSVYDAEFLLMSLIANPAVFRDNGEIDLKLIIDTNSLPFVVCCLGSEALYPVASKILGAIASYMVNAGEEEKLGYRDRSALRLFVFKMLNILEELKTEGHKMSNAHFIFLANVLMVACNPGHFLHSKVADYLLSGPTVRVDDIPLFKSITSSSEETLYREVAWLLDSLISGLATEEDVRLYTRKGVFEWAMNLLNSQLGKKSGLGSRIERLMHQAQETPSGSVNLITRNGVLAWAEMQFSLRKGALPWSKMELGFLATDNTDKVNAWVNGDRLGVAKRIKAHH
ncbi:nucleolar pre-ribosomal-associated protein 1 [Trichomonascus vanleenenianus]|uniref:Urb1p n=1 Tax=Trichomonascus vanleenenianus TaxID=2268995 RepID=UPI003ECA3A08